MAIKVLQIGKSNTIEIYRAETGLTVSQVQILDGVTGAVLETITGSGITSDTTSTTLSGAISLDTVDITVSGLHKNRRYLIEESGKPTTEIETIAVTSTTAVLKFPCTVAYSTSAVVKGILASVAWNPSTALTCRSVLIESTISGTVYTEEAILAEKLVACPVTLSDVLSRYSRIAGHEPDWQYRAGASWKPQIQEAWDQIRMDLLAQDVVLERIRSVHDLKELILARFALIICDMGLDPLGTSDISTSRRTMADKVKLELTRAFTLKMNVDNDETGMEQVHKPALRLGFERVTVSQWRTKG